MRRYSSRVGTARFPFLGTKGISSCTHNSRLLRTILTPHYTTHLTPLKYFSISANSTSNNSSNHLDLNLRITDSEVIQFLSQFSPAHEEQGSNRDDMALTALRIGVLSMRHAATQVDSNSIQREVDRMIEQLNHKLLSHEQKVHSQLAFTLQEYFDPAHGRFPDRIRKLVDEDGELVTLLQKQVVGEDSKLFKQMESLIGNHSPLLLSLSPNSKQGVVSLVSDAVQVELERNRKTLIEFLSPESTRSPLNALIRELKHSNEGLATAVSNSMTNIHKEFSTNDQNSTISRLIAGIDGMVKKVGSELSLDVQNSALARLRSEILLLNAQQASAIRDLEQKMIHELSAMNSQRKTEDLLSKRTPLHGNSFETALFDFLSTISPHDMITESVGTQTGLIRNCKVGDFVLTLGPEHIASGASIVVEAKANKQYSLQKALSELDIAKKNRSASIGLFVFCNASLNSNDNISSSNNIPHEPVFRQGNDIICVWDKDDANTNVYLRAAISLAKALCVRSTMTYNPHQQIAASTTQSDIQTTIESKKSSVLLLNKMYVDIQNEQVRETQKEQAKLEKLFTAMEKSMLDIQKQASGLDDIRKTTETIVASTDKILQKIRLSRSRLDSAAGDLDEYVNQFKNLKSLQLARDEKFSMDTRKLYEESIHLISKGDEVETE